MKSRYGVWRPVEGRLIVKMPYAKDNRRWLKEVLGARIRPEWNREEKRWEIARNHLREVVEALADRLGRIDVYLDFRQSERCNTNCQNAAGDECVCSCLGVHHGDGMTSGWKIAGEDVLVRSRGVIQRHVVVERER